jgi:hypothetical protein
MKKKLAILISKTSYTYIMCVFFKLSSLNEKQERIIKIHKKESYTRKKNLDSKF